MQNTTNDNENTNIVEKLTNEQIRSMSTPDLLMRIFEELHQVKKEHPRVYEAYKDDLKNCLIEKQICDINITGKDKTIWQALNETCDEDILHVMKSVQSISIFLECREDHDLPEYQEALQGWQFLNSMLNYESQKRIDQYSRQIEGE